METTKDQPGELLTIREVATEFKVKPGTIYQKVSRREIPYLKIGPLVRFRREDVEAYLAKHEVAPIT